MKRVIIVLMAVLALTGCATTHVDHEPFIEVVEVPGKTAGELFVEINQWAVDAFRSADSVIEFSDKESGIISGKYTTTLYSPWLGSTNIGSTLNIEAKDEKYRITINDPINLGTYGGLVTNAAQLEQVREKWINLASSLKAHVMKEKEDW